MIYSGYLDNPSDLISERDLPQEETDFVLWPINGECTEWATIDYTYKNQFGTRVVSDIITEKELSRSECEEAIRDKVQNVEFEQSMTIKYKA